MTHTVLGHYEIRRTIKRGGMGAVHEARDLRTGMRCAVKETYSDLEREARLLGRLSHPNLPRMLDCFREDGRSWLVMEYVDGQDLDECHLTTEQIVDVALQILDVLTYLHGLSPAVVYRDVKPSNIMRRADGRVFLVDFGIATTDERNEAVGTKGYAPPEQFHGMADPRSDLYALGATMHELLSGHAPAVPFAPLRQLRAEISLGLEAIVGRALALDVGERFQTADHMRNALLRLEGVPARSLAPARTARHGDDRARSARDGIGWGGTGIAWTPSARSSPGAAQARGGAEYQCPRCRRKGYSFSGLALQCSACRGPMVQLGSA